MADETKEVLILELKIDRGQGEKEIDGLTKSIEGLKKQNEDLLKANNALKKSGQESSREFLENAKQIELNKDALNKNTSARKNTITAIKSEDNSLGALKSKLVEQKKLRDAVNLSTEEGRKQFHQLTAEIKANTNALKGAEEASGTYSRNVGNYPEHLKAAAQASGSFGQSTVGLIDNLKGMLNPITAGIAAVGALGAAYAKSTTGAKDMAFVQDQASAVFSKISEDIGKLVGGSEGGGGKGLLSSLLDKYLELAQFIPIIQLIDVVSGDAASSYIESLRQTSEASAKAQENLRNLALEQSRAAGFAKSFEEAAEKARIVRDNADASYVDRQRALKAVEDNLNASKTVRVNVLNQEIEAIKKANPAWQKNIEVQIQVEEKQRAIRDISEEVTGKLTENTMAARGLSKEYAAMNAEAKAYADAIIARLDADDIAFAKEQERSDYAKMAAEQFRVDIKLNTETSLEADRMIEESNKRTADAKTKNAKASATLSKKFEMDAFEATRQIFAESKNLFKEKTAAYKVTASAETIMNTYAGATAAYKSMAGIPLVGPILGAIAAAVAVAGGLANLAKINAVKFARGGEVMTGAKHFQVGGNLHSQGGTKYYGQDGNVFEVERGENIFVMNRHANAAKIHALSNENVRSGGVPFSMKTRWAALGGSIETRSASQAAQNSSDITRIIRQTMMSMPPQIVLVEDINSVQGRVAEVNERSQVL